MVQRRALVLSPGRAAAVQPAVAPALEILIQTFEVGRVESHLGGRGHALVRAPMSEDVEELLPCRSVALRSECEEETRAERGTLSVLAVAAGALQAVLLPAAVGREVHRIAGWGVIGIGRGDARCRRRGGGRRRGIRR